MVPVLAKAGLLLGVADSVAFFAGSVFSGVAVVGWGLIGASF